jgi:predicted DNA-binding transcriptional regulator YafY
VRASRLVSILLLLQNRGRLTAPELARELEVSVRTVHRDVQALSEAGVPIATETGPHGGCFLVGGYRTRLTGLTEGEAAALFLHGAPTSMAELGLGTVLATAQLKVLAALPAELRDRATRVQERFHVDAPGWYRDPDDAPCLTTLAQALWDDRRVLMRYRRADGEVERRLDPLGLVAKAGVWYLVAANRGQVRTYRAGRVTSATVLDEPAERPAGFDLAATWAAAAEEFQRALWRVRVVARISPGGLRRLRHAIEPGAAAAAADSAGAPDVDGWRRVTIPAEAYEHAALELRLLGPEIEVLEPPALRQRLADDAAATAARYAQADGSASPPAG